MLLIKIIGIGIITTIAVVILKQVKPEIAVVIGLAGSIIILFSIVNLISDVISVFTNLADKTGISASILGVVIKIIGIGYLTEFAAGICADSGGTSIADKILIAGKVIIMITALPIITSLIDIVVGLLP